MLYLSYMYHACCQGEQKLMKILRQVVFIRSCCFLITPPAFDSTSAAGCWLLKDAGTGTSVAPLTEPENDQKSQHHQLNAFNQLSC